MPRPAPAAHQQHPRLQPHPERGRLLGFNDLLAGLTGAALALVGGVALEGIGVAALAIGGTVLVALPAIWIARSPLRTGRIPLRS